MGRIYIKGNGPTVACFLINFSKDSVLKEKFQIVLPAGWEFTGGYGFEHVNDSLLMNSLSTSDSLDISDANDYLSYCGEKTYTPRIRYKKYMIDRSHGALARLASDKKIVYGPQHENDLVVITPGFEKRYTTPVVAGSLTDWYQRLDTLNEAKGKVLIVGMGLCCVDAVTEILRSPHAVEIDCYSRSGYWPRTHRLPPYDDFKQADSMLELPINDADSLYESLHRACGVLGCESFWPEDPGSFRKISVPRTGIQGVELAAALRIRLSNTWQAFSKQQQQAWLQKYNLLYSKARIGMSYINAEKLLRAQHDGQLSVVSNIDRGKYDMVVDATGYRQRVMGAAHRNEHVIGAPTGDPFLYPSISESRRAVSQFLDLLRRS